MRQLANLDSINPVPIEKIWPALEKAAGNAPDDDRIWLGRANLAIRTGEFARASTGSTTACGDARATPVWKSRLDLALATGDVAGAREALGHLPPDGVPPEEVLALRAWFAAHRRPGAGAAGAGGAARARPGRVQAVERLAELELLAGRSERATRLRGRPSWIGPRSTTRSS